MDSLEERLRSAYEHRRRSEAAGAEERYRAESKTRLLRILKRKVTTGFIGALAAFERHFGALWGHGLKPEQCTETQLARRALWEQCRTEVLNNGNNQNRAVENELALYTVKWDRYVTTLPARGANQGPPPAPNQEDPDVG